MDEPPPQNLTTPTTDQPVLIITSHSHRRPLSRPPSLKFDLRKVSNPPKHIRDAYDGRSKRLREHMMHMKDFQELLDAAKKSVQEEMAVVLMRDGEDPEERNEAAPQISEAQEEDNISEIADDDTPQLVVSCFCERGKHRSVAFAEELSRQKWPREWAVELHHRNVEEANGNKQHQKNKSKANRKRQGDHGFGGSDVE